MNTEETEIQNEDYDPEPVYMDNADTAPASDDADDSINIVLEDGTEQPGPGGRRQALAPALPQEQQAIARITGRQGQEVARAGLQRPAMMPAQRLPALAQPVQGHLGQGHAGGQHRLPSPLLQPAQQGAVGHLLFHQLIQAPEVKP